MAGGERNKSWIDALIATESLHRAYVITNHCLGGLRRLAPAYRVHT